MELAAFFKLSTPGKKSSRITEGRVTMTDTKDGREGRASIGKTQRWENVELKFRRLWWESYTNVATKSREDSAAQNNLKAFLSDFSYTRSTVSENDKNWGKKAKCLFWQKYESMKLSNQRQQGYLYWLDRHNSGCVLLVIIQEILWQSEHSPNEPVKRKGAFQSLSHYQQMSSA